MAQHEVKLSLTKYLRTGFALPNHLTALAIRKVLGEGTTWGTEAEYRNLVYKWADKTAREILGANGWDPTFEDEDRYTHPAYGTSPRGTGGSRIRSSSSKSYSIATALRACGKNEVTVTVEI